MFHAVICIFCFSDRRSLKYDTRVFRVQVYTETNPGCLELPLTGTNFHSPSLIVPLKIYCIKIQFV